MRACNCGETLTRSVQENAANRTAATRARTQVCERPELFIGLGACDNSGGCASNFPGECTRSPRSGCLGTNANLRLPRPVRLSFGTQHHDWPGTLSRLRVRGP